MSILTVNGELIDLLIDSGSSEYFVEKAVVKENNWKIISCKGNVSMADSSHFSKILGYCSVNLKLQVEVYPNKLTVLPDLYTDGIWGLEFLQHHEFLEIPF